MFARVTLALALCGPVSGFPDGRVANTASATAEPGAAQTRRCRTCKGEGLVACGEHGREDLTHEHEVLYCSVVDGCPVCAGAGWLDCPECEDPQAEAALAERLAGIPGARERLAPLDEPFGRPLRKAESEHFVVVWEMTDLKVDKVRRDEHQMLHLTVQRLERLYRDYVELFGLEDAAFAKKSRVFVWQIPEEHERGSLAFLGLYAPRGTALMGADPGYSVSAGKRNFIGDEDLHRNLIHNVVHLLFSHEEPSRWIGHLNGGWFDAGLAHWFEDRYFGICDNYCYEETNTTFGFKSGKYKVSLRKLVDGGDLPPLAAAIRKNTTELDPEDHPLVFGMIDYLIQLDPKKTDELGRRLRAKQDVREALQEVFGFSILEFETRLHAFITETYPKR